MIGASLATKKGWVEILFLFEVRGGWFGTSPRRTRILIDGASVKEGLRRILSHGLKLNFIDTSA